MYKVLLTCPPMIGMLDYFQKDFREANFEVTVPEFTQEISEEALIKIIGDFDGWIIGDDPATEAVLRAGTAGRLRACMRWGVGTDNVDFVAFEKYKVPIENTPKVFGREVADLACHYVSALARHTYVINDEVRKGNWHKPIGTSLWSTKALIVGMGDIGQNLARRLFAHDIEVYFSDPYVNASDVETPTQKVKWPEGTADVDFIIFTAPLNDQTRHMLDSNALKHMKKGVKIVNVGRGPLIDENALINGLNSGVIHSAALDVFESEPFKIETHQELLKRKDKLIFGTHNGSNTSEAVQFVSRMTIEKLSVFLSKCADV